MRYSDSLHLTDLFLVDGSGRPPYRTEILIENGKIAAVSADEIGSAAGKKISCRGNIVSAGWTDVHGHSDISSLAHPGCTARISQGFTREICGNCGLSAFPITECNREHLEKLYRKYPLPLDWSDCAGYLAAQKKAGTLCRMVPMTGHNTLRSAVLGYDRCSCSDRDLEVQKELLAQSFYSGSCGLSLGLLYVPGKFAAAEELEALFRVTAVHNKTVSCHLSSEGDRLLESITALGDLALASGLKKLHISHFKTARKANFHKLAPALAYFAELRKQGVSLTFDRYPYTESLTQLSLVLPDEWSDVDDVTITRKLQDAELVRSLAMELNQLRSFEYWQTVRLADTSHPEYRKYRACRLAELPDPVTAVLEMLKYDSCTALAAFSGMSPENMKTILLQDNCMCGTDGTALPPDGSLGYDHPRSYGAGAKFMNLLLNWGVAIEEAVRRLTALPEQVFDLPGTSVVKPGAEVNLTVFDPETIGSRADFADPCRPAEGISRVFLPQGVIEF